VEAHIAYASKNKNGSGCYGKSIKTETKQNRSENDKQGGLNSFRYIQIILYVDYNFYIRFFETTIQLWIMDS